MSAAFILARSSRGVPVAITFPRCRTIALPTISLNPDRCVATRIVLPFFERPSIVDLNSSWPSKSTLLMGSSNISRGGSFTSARARPIFCRMP